MKNKQDLTPPDNIKLTQSGRSRSKCESCVDALECTIMMPSTCGKYCPETSYSGTIQFDVEISKPDLRRI
jgi:hypothetical protein